MRNRVIFGILVGIIAIVSIYFGGIIFNALMAFIGVWGAYEFSNTRNREIDWFEYIVMLVYVGLVNLTSLPETGLNICLIVLLCTITVFNEHITFEEACVSFLESNILAYAIKFAILAENTNKFLFGYIVIAAMVADVFALFAGMLFGKHKLNERVSPKKTIEGAIGGWLCSGLISFTYAYFFNYFGKGFFFILVASLILPVVSQIGDLTFSLIKRYFGIKDFSNLIPGHGGLLDRLDSTIFTLLIYGALSIFL